MKKQMYEIWIETGEWKIGGTISLTLDQEEMAKLAQAIWSVVKDGSFHERLEVRRDGHDYCEIEITREK